VSDREYVRGVVAHHWGVDTFILRRYPAREYRLMAEVRERMVKEHNDQIERARQGLPSDEKKPGRKPKAPKGQPADW
jgi:hypothetical protein